MDKKVKVILTQRWWDANRAKTLVDKGNLGKALKAFEGAFPLALVAKGVEKLERIAAAEETLKAVRVAAATTSQACVAALHGDTQWVLKNSFLKAVDDHEKALEKARATLKSDLAKMSLDDFYNDKSYRVLLAKACKKEHSLENFEFLAVAGWGGKRDQNTYNTYISDTASKQVNLPAEAYAGLNKANQEGKLASSKYWGDAVDAIRKLVERDTLPRLRVAIMEGKA